MSPAQIVVADADPEVRALLARFLEAQGYQLAAFDGLAGVLDAVNTSTSLVLLDLSVFEDGELEAVGRLRTLAPSMAVVISGTEHQAGALSPRADAGDAPILIKPFKGRELMAALTCALERCAVAIAEVGSASVASVWDSARQSGLSEGDEGGAAATAPPTRTLVPKPVDSALLAPPRQAPRAATGDLPPVSDADDASLLLAPPEAQPAHGDGRRDPSPGDQGAVQGAAPRRPFGPRFDTQTLLRTSDLYSSDAASAADGEIAAGKGAGPAEGGPAPISTGEPVSGVWSVDTPQSRPDLPELTEADESQYALQPMVPASPTDPRGIYGPITMPQLLYNCFRDLFSGRLVLSRGAVRKTIHLLNGRPTQTTSNVRSESQGHQLMRAGVIDSEMHRQSVLVMMRDGVRQGEALVRLEVISPETLHEELRRQDRERLINCFAWTDATYGLVYDPDVGDQHGGFETNPLLLIFEGVRRQFPVGAVVLHFDGYSRRTVHATPRLSDYSTMLRDFQDALTVAGLCDGSRTLGEVIARSPYGLVATLRILRALEIASCVGFGEPVTDAELDANRAPAGAPGSERGQASPAEPFSHRTTTGPRAPIAPQNRASTSGPRPGAAVDRGPNTGSRAYGSKLPESRGATERRPAPEARASGEHRSLNPSTGPRRPSPGVTGPRPVLPRTPWASAPPGAMESPMGAHARINAIIDRDPRLNHYEHLEIRPQATVEQIRAAGQRLTAELDPNRVAALGEPELVERARVALSRLNAALDTLLDRRRREEYDALHLAVPIPAARGTDIMQAESNFNRGQRCMENNETKKAIEFFDVACAQDAHQARYRAWLGWARFLVADPTDKRARTEAHDQIKAALSDDDSMDDGFVLLANTYRLTGNLEMAERFYRKALTLNRSNAEAGRELRRLESERKRDDEAGQSSIFGKLFTRR